MDKISELVEHAKNQDCDIIFDAELWRYTSFKIGGKCPVLIELNSIESCKILVPLASKLGIKYHIFGNGSNLIVDDYGISAVVFHINFTERFLKDNDVMYCEAGAKMSRICGHAANNSVSGLEFAYGIPGTIGGAIYMNAGAYGGEICDVVSSVEVMDLDGNVFNFTKEDCEFSYRNSIFTGKKYIILSAELQLSKEDIIEIKDKMLSIIGKRQDKQPLDYPSAGSTFKRPEGYFAARLIEESGLKGVSVGGAEVSKKHSGFIINKGGASFSDVMELIGIVKEKVYTDSGIVLECEPEIITERAEFV